MSNFSVLLLAAGSSSRFQDAHDKKPFVSLDNRAVWIHSAERFLRRDDVRQVLLVIAPADEEMFQRRFAADISRLGVEVVLGGRERADSVRNGLQKVSAGTDWVAIHDAARPCVTDEEMEAVFVAASHTGAAILATPVTSTLKQVSDSCQIEQTLSRQNKWLAQTPQVFAFTPLRQAYQALGTKKVTDDAELMERAGHAITVVEGSPLNIKITTRQDWQLAQAIVQLQAVPKFDAPPFSDDHLLR